MGAKHSCGGWKHFIISSVEIIGVCGNASFFCSGKQVLRTETAAVVAYSVILYELGELEG